MWGGLGFFEPGLAKEKWKYAVDRVQSGGPQGEKVGVYSRVQEGMNQRSQKAVDLEEAGEFNVWGLLEV